MDGDLDVRQYQPPDAARVLTVYELALTAHGWEFLDESEPDHPITDEFLGITEHFLDSGGEFLVGRSDDEIVAIGGFHRKDERTAEIRKMAVHPAHQRRGFGSRILAELERRAESRGFTRLVLETYESLTAARGLYEQYGYEETGRDPDDEFGEARISYRKEL